MPETFPLANRLIYPIGIRTGRFETLISEAESGKEIRRAKQDARRDGFSLNLRTLTLDQAWQLYDFYERHKGQLTAFYLWVPDCQLLKNQGFETGDFTGWTDGGAENTIDSTEALTGAYSSKLAAAGSDVTGAISDPYAVDIAKVYTFGGGIRISGYTGGYGRIALRQYNSGDTWIATASIQRTADQPWALHEKTIGPSESGADFTWNAATVKARIEQYCGNTPTMNLWVDDLTLRGPRRYLVRFDSDELTAEYFTYQRHKLSINVLEVDS